MKKAAVITILALGALAAVMWLRGRGDQAASTPGATAAPSSSSSDNARHGRDVAGSDHRGAAKSPEVSPERREDLTRRARPVLPAAKRAALLGIGASDEEAARVQEIERRRSDAFAAKDEIDFESEDDNYEKGFEILDEEEAALKSVLGAERAALYMSLRAEEVKGEVHDLLK